MDFNFSHQEIATMIGGFIALGIALLAFYKKGGTNHSIKDIGDNNNIVNGNGDIKTKNNKNTK